MNFTVISYIQIHGSVCGRQFLQIVAAIILKASAVAVPIEPEIVSLAFFAKIAARQEQAIFRSEIVAVFDHLFQRLVCNIVDIVVCVEGFSSVVVGFVIG
jgi:hypothetical protein